MDKLTDLELCKKIAEIDGEAVYVLKLSYGEKLLYGDGTRDRMPDYNPLTDKAMLWDLFVKYEAEIDYKEGKIWIEFGDCKQDLALSIFDCLDKDTIPRAALECIVEANNG